ncbi:TPM domain-containing protein [Acinetobacter sp. ANC 4779]|uniref:TPM domain-containing protein n=1 Tax=Acinetobacter sp. ANC 4779 TaxID=2529848 RepID=UPI00103BA94C|nr:TPM domain-containing protein [Acinetobacter sp. ANC 4779]TCB48983.1 TPM domain-containing protein [Acinetobacter sp. ANC 4779]
MFDSYKKYFSCIILLQAVLVCLSVLISSVTWSEVATATDENAEAIVVGKIIQDQQPTSPNQAVAKENATDTTVLSPQIANDMAEGESIRGLPTLNSPVVDQANILTVSQKQEISQRILALHEQSKAQIGVVIVPTTGQEDIFDFAMRIAEKWQLGSAKQDNGLLMAIAVNDHRIQILTGYGLEGVIPDIVASRIIRNQITPYFKQAQYAQGIDAGLVEIERILNMDPEVAQKAAQELKERQEKALHEQQAKEKTFSTALFILIAGIVGSFIVGKPLSASTAAVAGTVAGLVNGAGLVTSLLIGGGIFFLLITAIAQTIFQLFLASAGRGGGGGGRGGGFGGGGGFSGGGGGFGGGGASGSW